MNSSKLVAVAATLAGLALAATGLSYNAFASAFPLVAVLAARPASSAAADAEATGTPVPARNLVLPPGDSADVRCPPDGRLTVITLSPGVIELRCEPAIVASPAAPTQTPTQTSTPTTRPQPTLTATSPPAGPPAPAAGIWISRAEVRALPMTGAAWQSLLAAAGGSASKPSLCDQNASANVIVLAKALVYARTGDERYRSEVRQSVMAAMGTEGGSGCRSLALGRELAAYVIAADLVGLEAGEDERFRSWLTTVRTKKLGDGRSLVSCHEDRPNNWGTMCGASRVAASAYLRDTTDLNRIAAVFRGYVGDRSAYAGFDYGDLSWQVNAGAPVGINPLGATKQGLSIDGVIPDDMRRGSGFTTGCPTSTGYPWEALQGVVVQAEILHRQGYDAWTWQDQAVRRAVGYLYTLSQRCSGWIGEATGGDDRFIPWIVNHAYGTGFAATSPAESGKIMGWTDWTHNRATRPRR